MSESDGQSVDLEKSLEELERLVDAVKAAHSYDVPCVVALPIVAGNQDYLDWLCRETGGGTQS